MSEDRSASITSSSAQPVATIKSTASLGFFFFFFLFLLSIELFFFVLSATPHRFSHEAKALSEKFKSLLKETEADGWASLGTQKDVQISSKPVRKNHQELLLLLGEILQCEKI